MQQTALSYARQYERSVTDPDGFWREVAARVDWIRPFSRVKDVSFDVDDLHIRWFEDGLLNVAANCLDRHLENHSNDIAILWEGDSPGDSGSCDRDAGVRAYRAAQDT